jgi:hypothetical protein
MVKNGCHLTIINQGCKIHTWMSVNCALSAAFTRLIVLVSNLNGGEKNLIKE